MRPRLANEISNPHANAPRAEQELVAAAKAGDELAFEQLVKRYRARILAVALRYTRVREDAEDVAQQTLQKAFVALQRFEGKSSFATWLTRIAINEALMWLRKGRVQYEVSVEDSSSHEGTSANREFADASPDPETNYLRREVVQILSEAMGQLKPGTRSALELRDLSELTLRETARHMGLSVGAVKARVFKGRKKLREALRQHRNLRRTTGTAAANVSRTHLCHA